MNSLSSLTGRILLSIIFILSGFSKFSDPAGTIGYMKTAAFPIPMPEITVYAVAALELFGGLAILLGLGARWAALALAFFTLAAAIGFHANFSDQVQSILFMKNLAIAGGLLMLFAYGSGQYAVRPGS